MKTYSLDLRERALAAVDRGMPRKEALGVFGVSLATPKRWLKRRERTGSAAPKRRPGMRPRIGAAAEERRVLWRQLEENPEATLEEHGQAWERERGVRVSVATMSRAVRRLGWTYKQRRWEPPSETRRPEHAGAGGWRGSTRSG
jgi:transposase